jgi:Lrp/AsnC family transcriptional regulator
VRGTAFRRETGSGVTVFASVRGGEHAEKWLENFTNAVRRMPEVIEFYRMASDVDYLLKLQIADIAL